MILGERLASIKNNGLSNDELGAILLRPQTSQVLRKLRTLFSKFRVLKDIQQLATKL
jgi:hypothetical protein